MSDLTKRTTVYLEPELHKALQLQSLETSRSVSELINDAVRDELAQDAEDLAAFGKRAKEPTLDFEDFVKELKSNETI